jgi:acetyltransferase-like isoleucine patch superfamily enzyme
LGDDVTVDDYVLLDGRGASADGVRLEAGVMINRGCMVLAKHGDIRIGEKTTIGANSVIVSMDGVDIGAKVMFAGGCYISTGSYHVDESPGPIMDQTAYSDGPVVIGDGAWLGTGTIVLDAAKIGDDSVIGAGALVTDSIPANSIAIGTPAKVRRARHTKAATANA